MLKSLQKMLAFDVSKNVEIKHMLAPSSYIYRKFMSSVKLHTRKMLHCISVKFQNSLSTLLYHKNVYHRKLHHVQVVKEQ